MVSKIILILENDFSYPALPSQLHMYARTLRAHSFVDLSLIHRSLTCAALSQIQSMSEGITCSGKGRQMSDARYVGT